MPPTDMNRSRPRKRRTSKRNHCCALNPTTQTKEGFREELVDAPATMYHPIDKPQTRTQPTRNHTQTRELEPRSSLTTPLRKPKTPSKPSTQTNRSTPSTTKEKPTKAHPIKPNNPQPQKNQEDRTSTNNRLLSLATSQIHQHPATLAKENL
ncbi:predicted protein [Arabidopsis lyrata subsp. lyrata]|uniref:Predicted protein n=1 Tax=Arabidopsis lyrata subsp. lyrata TaxID=81972 RepID=D7M4T4_ARALL|nr:predicted protein [Arabidopsis lyrata subsp. lyrata]